VLANRRCKIVATIGPATQEESNLEKCILSGMNVARLNFSHGAHEQHKLVIDSLRRLSSEMKAPVTILQDLQGPKVRVGKFEKGFIDLKNQQKITITMKSILGNDQLIPSDFPELAASVKVNDKILMDDGLIELKVLEVKNSEIIAEVVYGGKLKDRKGINVPGVSLQVDSMTEKDLVDLDFGLQNKVDYVALSFVRHPDDILKIKKIINKKNPNTKICAKIEMREAIENLEEIIKCSDAVMVARGDLAVEVGQARLPAIQKRIIALCNLHNKPVITATQMLDSMVENPRPTRAEITDIANAVIDGSDALMLSAESASGKYPFKCIQTMHEIIVEVEDHLEDYYKIDTDVEYLTVPESIAASASLSALKLNAKAIVCLTTSGLTANLISNYRPKARIIAATKDIDTLNRLELIWGLQTLKINQYTNLKEAIQLIEQALINYGLASVGDKVVLTLGQPIADQSKTNSLHIFTLGDQSLSKLSEDQIPLRCRSIKFDF